MTIVRSCVAVGVVALASFVFPIDAHAQSFCSSSSPDVCPASSASYHRLRFNIIGSSRAPAAGYIAKVGTLDFAGTAVAAACISEDGGSTWAGWTIYDEQVGGILSSSSLNDESFLCASSGAENIEILEADDFFLCNSEAMGGLSSAGYSLDFYMLAGNDTLSGADDSFSWVCGGTGNDVMSNVAGGDGWTGNDRFDVCQDAICYGYDGCDRFRCGLVGSPVGECFGEEGRDCVMQTNTTSAPSTTINCGGNLNDRTPHASGTTQCEDSGTSTNCLTWVYTCN